jgi:putative transposase
MSRTTSRGKAPVRLLCEVFGVSRQAYYASAKAPALRLVKATATPACCDPRWVSIEALRAGIRAVVAENPGWGVRKVWATLRRDGLRVGRNRVWANMREMGLVLPPCSERDPDAPRGQVVTVESNRRWATDLTTVWTKRDGLVAVIPVIDCGDRVLLECAVTKSQESSAVLAPVERALRREFGSSGNVPDGLELRTDHGPQYTGADCGNLCDAWNLNHTLAPVGRPTGNAVAERVIQTLKVELVWTRDFETIDALREAVAAWVHKYNYARPHQALNWRTPAEERAAKLSGRLETAA